MHVWSDILTLYSFIVKKCQRVQYQFIGSKNVYLNKEKEHAHHKISLSVPAVLFIPEKRRKCWSDLQIRAAMRAVKEGLSSINQAVLNHNVPITTLYDQLSGRVEHVVNLAQDPIYSAVKKQNCHHLWNTVLLLGMKNHTKILHILLSQ